MAVERNTCEEWGVEWSGIGLKSVSLCFMFGLVEECYLAGSETGCLPEHSNDVCVFQPVISFPVVISQNVPGGIFRRGSLADAGPSNQAQCR